ncbi:MULTISPECIES: branched-chain amino acid ABC transporter permease [unclassified Haloferax]|uniref:Branched-chain amino acid ABC transporter permease n=1 Tax=Haloferax sp. Atlit-48N TaxID=2077198 RepID=A0ACD5I251_9EURY|nr:MULTISPECIES: branched-chain amino acid ABC transporter permease [unclassified Haloferax]RDZ30859.1 branched-chain amino acid ABC transporter permease [Haloferax sp. Atlit-48N]RDZ33865.1 branched-chain amino acid ABC transporter permease [Haloferax sp. Atlit-24N]RDZ38509.1 branched-chain amino acid ABC transporter permease [Haloferax sp. Atlit-47N]RLM36269.1 branched-chain amino acid ABC transporter permease [Haloferax sp. Atlit-109R]RLM41525.1 branched-chain amino acid ABC transporter perm
MSTDNIHKTVAEASSLISWDTWDRIKHTESFVLLSSVLFVLLFSYAFGRAPVVSDVFQGYHGLAITILIWSIFALGFNLLLGQTGLLSFGHAMFFGTASYAAALFAIHVYNDPLAVIVVGTLAAVALGAVAALILLRLHTVYFSIVALAIGQFLYFLAREPLVEITKGINGLEVPRSAVLGIFELEHQYGGLLGELVVNNLYLFVGVFFVAVVASITRIRKSPYGLIFKAIRENETRTAFVGLDVWRYKFAAFLLSAAIVGLAGGLMAVNTQFAGVERLYWSVSGDVVVMTVLGGLGTLAGPVIGTFVFFYFKGIVNGFPTLGNYWLLLLSLSFTTVVWVYRDGIWGMITALTGALRDPRELVAAITARVTGGDSTGDAPGGED